MSLKILNSQDITQLKRKPFHFWPYWLKRACPEAGSCALCLNRPIDFCDSDKRINQDPVWVWKPEVTNQEVFEAQCKDEQIGCKGFEDALKDYNKCPNFSWSRSVPFYTVSGCKAGEWKMEAVENK